MLLRASCGCFVVPEDVLNRLASDASLPAQVRQNLLHTAQISAGLRRVREAHGVLARATRRTPMTRLAPEKPAGLPPGQVYDCQHGTSLPGAPVASPAKSADATLKRAYDEELAVAKFYLEVFKRDSIDGQHMTIVSSAHYAQNFNNAFWQGSQMVYGDGDGQIFLDFTLGADVIGHELTHGVTQHSLGLNYQGEAGGLNESMSDVFGSMFRQWQRRETADKADWLIGAEIMGPAAKQKGFTCLRDMAAPAAPHALGHQPDAYSPGIGNLDPHASSGPPNLAFHNAAVAIGGYSWEKSGQIWYQALTGAGPNPDMTMAQFAASTRKLAETLYAKDASIAKAVDGAWDSVGL